MRVLLLFTVLFSTIFILSCSDCKCSSESNCSDSDVTDDADETSDSSDEEQDAVTEEEPDVFDEDVVVEEDVEEDIDESLDEGSDDSDEIVCQAITLGDLSVDHYSDGVDYTGDPGAPIGDVDKEDWIQMMFYPDPELEDGPYLEIGSYDLSVEHNQDFFFCQQCIMVFEDYDEESESPTKAYFQETGTMEVTEIKDGTGQSKGVLNAKLVQVYLDMISMSAIKVDGGSCLEFKDEPWDTFCTPNCTDKICGSDGCYDTCGDCESGLECNDAGTSCDPIPTDDDVSDADVDM